MPIYSKHSTHLSAAQFHAISTVGKGSFIADYKRFKKESHCKDLEDVIKLTGKLVQNNSTENDLFYIREGLKTLRDRYDVTVQKDHPFKSFLRVFFPKLFLKHDQKVKLSLDHMIDDISQKLDKDGRRGVDFDRDLVARIKSGEDDILTSKDIGHKNVQRLVRDPEFCKEAEKFIRDISSVGKETPVEQMQFIIKEVENLKEKYGGKEIDHRELIYSAIFAGKEYVPHLVSQLVKIRDDNYEIVFPPPGNQEIQVYSKYFEFLANGIHYCSQDAYIDKVDLLHERIADGIEVGFGRRMKEIKQSQSEKHELLKNILSMKEPSLLELVREMNVFVTTDTKDSPENNLLKLTQEFDRLVQAVQEAGFVDKLDENASLAIAEAFLIGLGMSSQNFYGGTLEDLQGFVVQLNNLLQKVDYGKLVAHNEYDNGNQWISALISGVKNISEIDLEGVYLNPPESKIAFEANFSGFVQQNLESSRGKIIAKAVDASYKELDKSECVRISELLGNRTFRKEAKSFLKKISRESSKSPHDEIARMRMELNRFAVKVNRKLPKDEKIQVEELETALRAALLSDGHGKRSTALLIKMNGLLEKEPSLLVDDPFGLEVVRKDFQQCKIFRNALDFCCQIDPENLVEREPSIWDRSFGEIELADFDIEERKYQRNISETLEKMFYKIQSEEFKSENKQIYDLIKDPTFTEDARKLYYDFLNTKKWAGTSTKSEQFGMLFDELILRNHARKAGLRPSEVSNQQKEAFLIIAALAAREYAPEVFSKLESMALMSSRANILPTCEGYFCPQNSAHEVTFDMHMIATVIGKEVSVAEVKEYAKRVPELIEHQTEEIFSDIQLKSESSKYQGNDKLDCESIVMLIKDEAFLEEVDSFIGKITTGEERSPEVELARIHKELSLLVENTDRACPDLKIPLNEDDPESLEFIFKAALLTDRGQQQLSPLVMKMVSLIQLRPELINPESGTSYEYCRLICNVLDAACKVDPRALIALGGAKTLEGEETLSKEDKALEQGIIAAVNTFERANESELFEKVLAVSKFAEDSKQFFRDWIVSLPHSGSETKLEQFGREFQEVIGKKYVTKFFGSGEKGADEGLELLAISCVAAKEVVPELLRKFKTLDPEIISKPETANRYIAFMFHSIISGFEEGIL